ncbi:MAG TPA: SRPBCC family protein [Conexibacter sp.]|nr:SRPBCC family protein [Conexibacter sp.]
MATNERFMPVPPEAVWAALADAYDYAYWVVGSTEIRDVDESWPAPGSRFHHTVGVRPLRVSDHTESLEARRPSLLRIRAKARPLGTAVVTMAMTPQDGGTHVRMTENPDGLTGWLSLNPLVQLLVKGRNAESLMRLEELALLRAGQSPS